LREKKKQGGTEADFWNDHRQPTRDTKFAVIEFQVRMTCRMCAARTLELDTQTGVVTLADAFEFAAPLAVEEAFTTAVETHGSTARITGERAALNLEIVEPAGAVFAVESLDEDCRANLVDGVLTRLSVALPDGAARFRMRMTPDLPHP
jgi:hypothetical protein